MDVCSGANSASTVMAPTASQTHDRARVASVRAMHTQSAVRLTDPSGARLATDSIQAIATAHPVITIRRDRCP